MNLNVGPKPLKGTYCRPLKGSPSPRPRGAEGCSFDGHDEIALCQAGLAGKWILKLVITVRLLHVLLRRLLLLLLIIIMVTIIYHYYHHHHYCYYYYYCYYY